jgi:hypothetical protein
MATVTRKVCDVNPRHPVTQRATAVLGDTHYSIEVCDRDAQRVKDTLVSLGFREQANQGGHPRKLYTAASGERFTMLQAREWLRAQGHPVPTGQGQISRELMAKYAEAH